LHGATVADVADGRIGREDDLEIVLEDESKIVRPAESKSGNGL